MNVVDRAARRRCEACKDGDAFGFPFTMAFQPIVDTDSGETYAYEALARGVGGEPAAMVLGAVNADNRYAFDQACRVKAIETAARVGMLDTRAKLSINFLPNAVYEPAACIRQTLIAAERTGFPLNRLIFEITEGEEVVDTDHLQRIITTYRSMGFRTAIDDFGSGFSNLRLLARVQPDILKLDMELIRDIDTCPVKRTIVRNVVHVCEDLGITVIAEGIETVPEYEILRDRGVHLFQGYLFARPGFESLPAVWLPKEAAAA